MRLMFHFLKRHLDSYKLLCTYYQIIDTFYGGLLAARPLKRFRSLELVGNLSFGLKKRLFRPDLFKFNQKNDGYYG